MTYTKHKASVANHTQVVKYIPQYIVTVKVPFEVALLTESAVGLESHTSSLVEHVCLKIH